MSLTKGQVVTKTRRFPNKLESYTDYSLIKCF